MSAVTIEPLVITTQLDMLAPLVPYPADGGRDPNFYAYRNADEMRRRYAKQLVSMVAQDVTESIDIKNKHKPKGK